MLRVFKTHVIPDPLHPGSTLTIQYSSYPGSVSSTDDFFQMSSGLVVMETTIDVYNGTLFDIVKPSGGHLSWPRVMTCNVVARSGPEWASCFTRFNGGTYNNEWIVVDYNLFTPGSALPPNTLTIADQLPGMVVVGDYTEVLNYGYFPSYNLAVSPLVRSISGVDAMVRAHDRVGVGLWVSAMVAMLCVVGRYDCAVCVPLLCRVYPSCALPCVPLLCLVP